MVIVEDVFLNFFDVPHKIMGWCPEVKRVTLDIDEGEIGGQGEVVLSLVERSWGWPNRIDARDTKMVPEKAHCTHEALDHLVLVR